MHGSLESSTLDLVKWSTEYFEVYRDAQIPSNSSTPSALPSTWTPLGCGFIKLNVDVAFPKASDFYRIGIVAHNDHGDCMVGSEGVTRSSNTPPPRWGSHSDSTWSTSCCGKSLAQCHH